MAARTMTLIKVDRGEEDFPAAGTTCVPMMTLTQDLTIRRELSPGGYLLRFSRPEAERGAVMEDMVERSFRPIT